MAKEGQAVEWYEPSTPTIGMRQTRYGVRALLWRYSVQWRSERAVLRWQEVTRVISPRSTSVRSTPGRTAAPAPPDIAHRVAQPAVVSSLRHPPSLPRRVLSRYEGLHDETACRVL